MSRRSSLLIQLGSLYVAFACSAAPLSSPPPGSAGDSSSGGSDGQGGSSGNTSGGGSQATGGVVNNTDGGAPTTGGLPGLGGSPPATGGTPSTSTTPAVTVNMSLSNLSADTLQGNLTITLPNGAAPIQMSTFKLTLCGAGGGGTAQASAMQIYNLQLRCPQTATTGCPIGQTINLQATVTVSGAGPSCCFNFDFSSSTNTFAPGPGITLNYAQDITKGNTLSHQTAQVWSAFVSGEPTSGKCTIPSASSTVTCS